MSIWHWLVVIGLVCSAFWPLLSWLSKRPGTRVETDREVLDRLAPRAEAQRTQTAVTAPHEPPVVAVAHSRSPMSTRVKVVLTLFYIPGGFALYVFWRLVHPTLVHHVALIDFGFPKLTAAVFALIFSLVPFAILVPFFVLWRRPPKESPLEQRET